MTTETNNSFSPQTDDPPAFAAGGRGQLGNPTPTALYPQSTANIKADHVASSSVPFTPLTSGKYFMVSSNSSSTASIRAIFNVRL